MCACGHLSATSIASGSLGFEDLRMIFSSSTIRNSSADGLPLIPASTEASLPAGPQVALKCDAFGLPEIQKLQLHPLLPRQQAASSWIFDALDGRIEVFHQITVALDKPTGAPPVLVPSCVGNRHPTFSTSSHDDTRSKAHKTMIAFLKQCVSSYFCVGVFCVPVLVFISFFSSLVFLPVEIQIRTDTKFSFLLTLRVGADSFPSQIPF